MENSERQKFEKTWSEVFQQAEQAPSEKVWVGVEHELNLSEKVTMKRRVVFYQRLAAATLLFALAMGGVTTFFISDSLNEKSISELKSNETGNTDLNISNESDDNNERIDKQRGNDDEFSETSGTDEEINYSSLMSDEKDPSENSGRQSLFASNSVNESRYVKANKTNRKDVAIYSPSLQEILPEPEVRLKSKVREVTLVRKLPAMPAAFMASKKKTEKSENVWASLGASTGNYSPSTNLSSSSTAQSYYLKSNGTANSLSGSSTSSPRGSAFSVGMNVGKRISDKWLLQGGVSYLTQTIGYTSNFATVSSANQTYVAVVDFADVNNFASMVSVANPYQINSLNEFLSIPVQAGYLLVDRKFGVQLNSGVSTDFFIQNTLSDKSGQLSSYSTGAGEDSPFRTVSWAGLLGTELSYKLGSSYRFSLVPGLRYSLGSILKTDAVNSNPLVWDVGFRCRYIFK